MNFANAGILLSFYLSVYFDIAPQKCKSIRPVGKRKHSGFGFLYFMQREIIAVIFTVRFLIIFSFRYFITNIRAIGTHQAKWF